MTKKGEKSKQKATEVPGGDYGKANKPGFFSHYIYNT